ncbi:Sec-independent protein translocase protein TatC [Pelosinus sp. IPA-1]|nr:Sec-independent protein translocase protein TatC [Pelosinus sp. IPA-1]
MENGFMLELDNQKSDTEPMQEITALLISMLDQLQEVRIRLIKIIVAVAVGSGISYFYAAEILQWITVPAGHLYYMNPAEAFFSYLKISFFAGFLLALPVVLYQAWAFIISALKRKECTALAIVVPSSVILFFAGLAFSYYLVLPAGIIFFMGFATENLQPMFSLSEYLSLVISFLLPFGFIFELPLLIMLLANLGIISSMFLISKRKIFLVLAFVMGAVLSPTPDVLSQTMVALPMLILYEISIMIVKYVLRK